MNRKSFLSSTPHYLAVVCHSLVVAVDDGGLHHFSFHDSCHDDYYSGRKELELMLLCLYSLQGYFYSEGISLAKNEPTGQ